jgi:hypothetical protein
MAQTPIPILSFLAIHYIQDTENSDRWRSFISKNWRRNFMLIILMLAVFTYLFSIWKNIRLPQAGFSVKISDRQ